MGLHRNGDGRMYEVLLGVYFAGCVLAGWRIAGYEPPKDVSRDDWLYQLICVGVSVLWPITIMVVCVGLLFAKQK